MTRAIAIALGALSVIVLVVAFHAPVSADDCRIPAIRLPALWIPYVAQEAQP